MHWNFIGKPRPARVVACGAWLALLGCAACSGSDSREEPGANTSGSDPAAPSAEGDGREGTAPLDPAAEAGGEPGGSISGQGEGNPTPIGGVETGDNPMDGSAMGGSPMDGSQMTGAEPAEGVPTEGVPAEPRVRFVGRFDALDPQRPRFAWSGSGMLARFSGTSVSARLTGNQEYTVLIDGMLRPKLVSTGSIDLLADDLDPGEHLVELYRRTEAAQGEAQFLGFDFGMGELLAPPPAPERRIEIIGDSISAGYGNEGANMSCSFTPATENHYLTYGAIAARNVGADLVTVAWSGKGVVCNYGDEATSCTEPMPTYFDRILPNRADSVWDFSAYQPQAVVINLGTNDFSTALDPAAAEFEAAYVTLLERVRAAYADATVLCTVGPLLSGTDLGLARDSIANAVRARTAAGDAKVKLFELAETDPTNGYGCDFHPSLRTHEVMAEVLTTTLQNELGW